MHIPLFPEYELFGSLIARCLSVTRPRLADVTADATLNCAGTTQRLYSDGARIVHYDAHIYAARAWCRAASIELLSAHIRINGESGPSPLTVSADHYWDLADICSDYVESLPVTLID